MSFFQNPFTSDFRGNLVLGDRQHVPGFNCPRNSGRSDDMVVSWGTGPFDLSTNDVSGNPRNILTLAYSFEDSDFKRWILAPYTLTSGIVMPHDLVTLLNADTGFSHLFTAVNDSSTRQERIQIRQKKPVTRMRFYVVNGGAEEALRFNARAGVAELPLYFARHTVENSEVFSDSCNSLVLLDTYDLTDAAIVNNAVDNRGISLRLDATSPKEDWQLMYGRSGIFNFQNLIVDGSDRITQIIEYPAGAKVGDLARKIQYVYTSSNLKPSQITEIPYVLTAADLVTP